MGEVSSSTSFNYPFNYIFETYFIYQKYMVPDSFERLLYSLFKSLFEVEIKRMTTLYRHYIWIILIKLNSVRNLKNYTIFFRIVWTNHSWFLFSHSEIKETQSIKFMINYTYISIYNRTGFFRRFQYRCFKYFIMNYSIVILLLKRSDFLFADDPDFV